MPSTTSGLRLIRRRFVFWVGLGLFTLGEKLNARGFDELAAAITREDDAAPPKVDPPPAVEHWTESGNRTWRWYERENFVAGRWKVTGITTPVHRATGEPYSGRSGYLDEALVPVEVRSGRRQVGGDGAFDAGGDEVPGLPDARRRARHGRPPSKWLRSLRVDELRIWLATIDVPEAGVSGMTFAEHLTRDHSFAAEIVMDLTIDEQALLHAAAHDGY